MVYDCISDKLQLVDTMLSGGFNDDLPVLANQKATQLKRDKAALYDRIEELKRNSTLNE